MSCACENKKYGQERERIRKLAKSLALLEKKAVGIYKLNDGTFGFDVVGCINDKEIIELITPYI